MTNRITRPRRLREAEAMDPGLRAELDALFSPRLLWRLRSRRETNSKFSTIVRTSAARALSAVGNSAGDPITAAVSRMAMDGASWRDFRPGDRAWQTDAWRLYDITGQLRFVANWVGSSVSRCNLYVARVRPDGSPGERVDTGQVAALSRSPLGEGDAKAEALRLLAVILFVAGEAYVVAEAGAGRNGEDVWWVVTARQISKRGDKITIPRPPGTGMGGTMEYREGVDLIIRVWNPHPSDVSEPDSSTRSAIPDLRELEALRKREFAELDSRLSGAGIFAIPESMDLPRGDDDPAGASGFTALLGRVMSRSLQDRSSAEAMVPIIVTGPGEDVERIRHITLWSPLSAEIGPMREGALKSLAQSLDIPPEVMLGIGASTNHWNAWAISREAVQIHIKPILTRIAAALTAGYLWPAMDAMGVEDETAYMYAFDTAPLTVNPDRSADAKDLHDRLLISDDVARRASSWSDDDAPSGPERALRLTERLLLTAPDAVLSDPALRSLTGLPPATSTEQKEQTTTATPDNPTKTTPPESPPEEPTNEDQPPDGNPPSETLTGSSATTTAIQVSALTLAGQLAVQRALGLAGTRVVPHSKRPRETPPYQLHVSHGPISPNVAEELINGKWEREFSETIERIGIDSGAFLTVVKDHCRTLLTRGIAYDDEEVTSLFTSPKTLASLGHRHDDL